MNARRKRILILDASEHVLMNLERLLEENGFDTTTTWEMREALDALGGRHYDLLLIGEHPPDVDAAEILRQMQYQRLSTPTMILLPELYPFEPEYFYSLGASAVISNWQYSDLVRRVNERFEVRVRAASAGD